MMLTCSLARVRGRYSLTQFTFAVVCRYCYCRCCCVFLLLLCFHTITRITEKKSFRCILSMCSLLLLLLLLLILILRKRYYVFSIEMALLFVILLLLLLFTSFLSSPYRRCAPPSLSIPLTLFFFHSFCRPLALSLAISFHYYYYSDILYLYIGTHI